VIGFFFAAIVAGSTAALAASTLRVRSAAVFVVGWWVLVCA
jgi:hypothetical protein